MADVRYFKLDVLNCNALLLEFLSFHSDYFLNEGVDIVDSQMINIVVPVVALSAAPFSHHSWKYTPKITHEDVKPLSMGLERHTLAALNHPGMRCITNTMLKVYYIHRLLV